jgi:hypothetical protein
MLRRLQRETTSSRSCSALETTPDSSTYDTEWEQLKRGEYNSKPASKSLLQDIGQYTACLDNEANPASMRPATGQGYIGINQGLKTFTMVVVDTKSNELPKIVAAHQCNLQSHGFGQRRSDNTPGNVLRLLIQHTPLLQWMQATGMPPLLPEIDRTVVLLEQISPINKYSKSFGIDLGKLLQVHVPDVSRCVVQMSQPHVYCRTGPMFQFGADIVIQCELQAPSYYYSVAIDEAIAIQTENLTNSDDPHSDGDITNDPVIHTSHQSRTSHAKMRRETAQKLARKEYPKKKEMSHSIFTYF